MYCVQSTNDEAYGVAHTLSELYCRKVAIESKIASPIKLLSSDIGSEPIGKLCTSCVVVNFFLFVPHC